MSRLSRELFASLRAQNLMTNIVGDVQVAGTLIRVIKGRRLRDTILKDDAGTVYVLSSKGHVEYIILGGKVL